MKIAFLNIYNGKVERGAEIFVKELAERLSSDFDVCVYQSGEKQTEKYAVKSIRGIPFRPHQGPKSSQFYHFYVLLFTLKCIPDLWKKKYDWIIPVNGRWQVLVLRLFRFLRGGKILISGHAGVGFEDRWNMLLGNPDIFVPLSMQAFTWAKNIYPENKLRYIPNGVDTDKFKQGEINVKLSIPKPIILCVSALLPYKRIDLLIKAVSKLETANLLIIGDGPLKLEITDMGKLVLKTRFHLIPYISHEEILTYYRAAQLFSLPSRESEAFGLVYLEAMACNLPVVAPDDINRREIIGDAGILGDIENTEIYAKLLDKALHTDFGGKPRKQAEKFSWEKLVTSYRNVLEEN